jgi:hypothetical protein
MSDNVRRAVQAVDAERPELSYLVWKLVLRVAEANGWTPRQPIERYAPDYGPRVLIDAHDTAEIARAVDHACAQLSQLHPCLLPAVSQQIDWLRQAAATCRTGRLQAGGFCD